MFALIRFELRKLIAQKKSLMGLGTIVLINLLFSIAFFLGDKYRGGRPHPGAREHTVSSFANAFQYVQAILAPCAFLLFPMVLAVMGGYMLAGELEDGSMRMMLFRPVSRWQVLVAKFAALSGYALAMLALLGGLSYALACLQLPNSGHVVIVGPVWMLEDIYLHAAADMPWRIAVSYLLAWPMMMSVTAMALMFALVMRHYTSSAILTTAVYISSWIIGMIPMLDAIHPYLPTRYWPFWRFVLMNQVPWGTVAAYAGWTAAYTVAFLALGAAIFNARDI